MATTTLIPLHIGKGRSVAAALGRSTNYVKNPDKTDGGEWVTAYECDPLTAEAICCKGRNRKAPTKQQGGQPIRSSLSGTAGKGVIRHKTFPAVA